MNPLSVELIRFKDNLYIVKRKYAESKVTPSKMDDLRIALNCDVTLRKEGMLYYCKKIDEAEVVSADNINS